MADVNSTVQNAASGVVGVIKALIVLFVFVNIVYSTGFDPIGGIVDLVNTFLDGGFAGLLALLVFLSFLGYQYRKDQLKIFLFLTTGGNYAERLAKPK